MKNGFRIEIQSDLSEDQKDTAKKFADHWIKMVNENGGKWANYGDLHTARGSVYNRNVLGRSANFNKNGYCEIYVDNNPENLIFRRISKNRRVFGIVKLGTVENYLDYFNGRNSIVLFGKYDGGSQFYYDKEDRIRPKFNRPQMEFYYEQGEIKG